MKAGWVQAAGYAEDLQAAYDYHKARGGERVAERFFARYQSSVAALTTFPRSAAIRGHGWRQKPIPSSIFSIFYGMRGGFWMLVGIQSTLQDPDHLQALLLIREVGETTGGGGELT